MIYNRNVKYVSDVLRYAAREEVAPTNDVPGWAMAYKRLADKCCRFLGSNLIDDKSLTLPMVSNMLFGSVEEQLWQMSQNGKCDYKLLYDEIKNTLGKFANDSSEWM